LLVVDEAVLTEKFQMLRGGLMSVGCGQKGARDGCHRRDVTAGQVVAWQELQNGRHLDGYGAAHITKDEDFADQVLLGGWAPVVVWVRRGNMTRHQLLDSFEQRTARPRDRMVGTGERLVVLR
jgi:hypothetical protein